MGIEQAISQSENPIAVQTQDIQRRLYDISTAATDEIEIPSLQTDLSKQIADEFQQSEIELNEILLQSDVAFDEILQRQVAAVEAVIPEKGTERGYLRQRKGYY